MSYASVMNAEMAYQKRVEALLTDENCYKIITVSAKDATCSLLFRFFFHHFFFQSFFILSLLLFCIVQEFISSNNRVNRYAER